MDGSAQPRPPPAISPAVFPPSATTRGETRTSATTVAVRPALRSATAVSRAATFAALAATPLSGPRLCPSRASELDRGSLWLLSAWRWSPSLVRPAQCLCNWPAVGTIVSVHSPAQSCGRTHVGEPVAVPWPVATTPALTSATWWKTHPATRRPATIAAPVSKTARSHAHPAATTRATSLATRVTALRVLSTSR